MTDEEIISKFQTLKQIKPRENWVLLVKNQIFDTPMHVKNDNLMVENAKTPRFNALMFGRTLTGLFYQRKFAYALAMVLFVFIGGFSLLKYGLSQNMDTKVAKQSATSLAQENTLKNNVEIFKTKSKNLAEVAKNKSQDVSLALKEVKDAAKNLNDTIQKNPQLAKTVALDINNSKSYLDITEENQGDDLEQVSNTVYKTLVEQLIKDQKETTLTKDQQMVLDNVVNLENQGKYSDALVNMLLLIHSADSKDTH